MKLKYKIIIFLILFMNLKILKSQKETEDITKWTKLFLENNQKLNPLSETDVPMGTGTPVFDASANLMLLQINLSKKINSNFDKNIQKKLELLDKIEKSARFINEMKTLKEIVSLLSTLACALDRLNQLKIELVDRNLILNNCVYDISIKLISLNLNGVSDILNNITFKNYIKTDNGTRLDLFRENLLLLNNTIFDVGKSINDANKLISLDKQRKELRAKYYDLMQRKF